MDITLERILSLLPRKPDGKYVHGAKKQFAESIGLKGGESVTMWESGSSTSYMRKLHEIAAKYDVSVEWLRGETDEKKPAPQKESGQSDVEYIKSRLPLMSKTDLLTLLDEISGELKKEV